MEYLSLAMQECLEAAQQASRISELGATILGDYGPEIRDLARVFTSGCEVTYMADPKVMGRQLVCEIFERCRCSEGPCGLILHQPYLLSAEVQARAAHLPKNVKIVVTALKEDHNLGGILARLRERTELTTISIPHITKRKEDWVNLVLYTIADACGRLGLQAKDAFPEGLDQEAWDLLLGIQWQSSHEIIAAAKQICQIALEKYTGAIQLRHFPYELLELSPHGWLEIPFGKRWTGERLADAYTLHCTARARTKTQAAAVIGITRVALYNRLKVLQAIGFNPENRKWKGCNGVRKEVGMPSKTPEQILEAIAAGKKEHNPWYTPDDIAEMRRNPTERWTRTGGRKRYHLQFEEDREGMLRRLGKDPEEFAKRLAEMKQQARKE